MVKLNNPTGLVVKAGPRLPSAVMLVTDADIANILWRCMIRRIDNHAGASQSILDIAHLIGRTRDA